jgi:phosphoglycolate phosphatase-like HAD superfamily hydrolase
LANKLKLLNIANYFTCSFSTSEDFQLWKPNPKLAPLFLERVQCQKVLVIGDREDTDKVFALNLDHTLKTTA